MDKIRTGVLKFQSEVFPQKRELYERAASIQRPHSLFVTCTDSRVDPEGFTQSNPGDIFVERNPGNLIPSYSLAALGGVSASVEYAVSILKVRHIVVCGHSNCGGVNGILHPETVAGLPAVSRWLRFGAAAKERLLAEGSQDVNRLTELNVLVQLENLQTHPCVKEHLKAGSLTLFGWVYEIHTGEVREYVPEKGKFVPVSMLAEVPDAHVAKHGEGKLIV